MTGDQDIDQENDDILNDSTRREDKFREETTPSEEKNAQNHYGTPQKAVQNKRILAAVLAIVLGAFGIHKFILGYTKEGIILLVITLVLGALTCGVAGWAMSVVGIIEGIMYLTKSDDEFYRIYQVGHKPWF
ncbi:TM2 domain-containing membrane protein YozV [Flavobacteriaceae bacterium MAR_2010_188]|nr:TM2 domain-containing membrane protein YozV [Flavobacteriaceae bacterium MAR_2010_188]